MSITEYNAHLKYKDTEGNTTIIYPVTKVKNVEGILPINSGGTGASDATTAREKLGIAPASIYSTDDIVAGSASDEVNGTIAIITSTNGAKSVFITVDGFWRLIWDVPYHYNIKIDSSNMDGISSSSSSITSDGTIELMFTVDTGYTLPETVTVEGASSYEWDRDTGILKIYDVTGDVTVSVVPEKIEYTITTKVENGTASSSNDTMVRYRESVTLTFEAETGYELPDSVEVEGATISSWNKNTGELTLDNVIGVVTVMIIAEKIEYSITVNCYKVTAYDSNPTTVLYGDDVELRFTANEGYWLPDISSNEYMINVKGATLKSWNNSTGILCLTNITGDITVTIYGAAKQKYYINYNLDNVTAVTDIPEYMYEGDSISITFKAYSGYELCNYISIEGADYDWEVDDGLLTLYNPTGLSDYTAGLLSMDINNIVFTIHAIKLNSCITFRGDEGAFTLTATNKSWDGSMLYSTDKVNWNTWDGGAISSNDIDELYLRGDSNTTFYSSDTAVKFVLSAKAGCYGNINTLLDYNDPPDEIPNSYCYCAMFSGCNKLTRAPELPATELKSYCYLSMFALCTSLTEAPELPAYLNNYKYTGYYMLMFDSCINLTKAPELPNTALGLECYKWMFYNCEALTTAPSLESTSLNNDCYYGMFEECHSLTSPPKLPATTLADSCYYEMFKNCENLITVPELPATTLADSCYYAMFMYCTLLGSKSKGVPPKLPATTLPDNCYSVMFYGCSSIKISDTLDIDYLYGYRIPSSGTGTAATGNSLANMFNKTGGSFTATPSINTLYYVMDGDTPLERG